MAMGDHSVSLYLRVLDCEVVTAEPTPHAAENKGALREQLKLPESGEEDRQTALVGSQDPHGDRIPPRCPLTSTEHPPLREINTM